MTIRITNQSQISLPLAVWLLDDNYDYINEENYVSVTTLMRPIRQIILPPRIPPEKRTLDVGDFIATSLGSAIHDAIEGAWLKPDAYQRALKLLGIPEHIIDRIKINPTPEQVRDSNEIIPIYLEQRGFREIDGYNVGGKFDIVADGIVQDNKSTSVWNWIKGTRDEENVLQMSLYRWIDAARPVRRITEDYCIVNYIFTDWAKGTAKRDPSYPQSRVCSKQLPLLSLSETEQWVRNKLALIKKYQNVAEEHIPECTDEELWRSDPQFKYYSDPIKASTGGRATRNFATLAEANAFKAEKGKGVVISKPGEVKRCGYCPAFEGCSQKDKYL